MAIVNDEYVEQLRAAQSVRILGSLELASEFAARRWTDTHGTTWWKVWADGQEFEAIDLVDALAQAAQWLAFERTNEPVGYVLTELVESVPRGEVSFR